MSGGLPPETAVARIVGSWSPAGVYFTVTFGYCFLKPSRTAWKFFCSSPVQTPVNDTVPETLVAGAVEAAPPAVDAAAGVAELELDELEPPPQAATARATAATASGPNRCERCRRIVGSSSSSVRDAEARLGVEEVQGVRVD